MVRSPKRGHFGRSRSLDDFNKRFGPESLQRIIKDALAKKEKVRILEIGCGEGRVLMELRKLFHQVDLYGINKEPWPAMKGQESLRRTGTLYKIFKKGEINAIKLPKIYFYDATKIMFKDNYFDVIYSQTSIPYFERKDKLIEEIYRVLKVGGKALLHIDSFENYYPDFMRQDTPRFIIYNEGKLLNLPEFFRRFKSYGINAELRTQKNAKKTYLEITKKIKKRLILGLNFDENSSFRLINVVNGSHSDIFWGYRSVFSI